MDKEAVILASTSFANPAVAIARAFTDSFSGIRPADLPGFILAETVGALLSLAFFGWLFKSPPASRPAIGGQERQIAE